MSLDALVRVRPVGRWSIPGAVPAVLGGLVFSLILGWYAFAFADSVSNVAPQRIRMSAEGQYDPYLDDFTVFYSAGALVREGDATQLYDPAAMHREEAETLAVNPDSVITLPFYNPPGLVLPLVALALLPLGPAAVVWTLVQLALFSVATGVVVRRSGQRNVLLTVAVLLAVVSSMPFHETLLHGQVSFALLAALIAICFGAFRGRRDGLAVLGLTLLAVKPQLVLVFAAYFIVQRRWRVLAWAALLQALQLAMVMLLIDTQASLHWLSLAWAATHWENQDGIWIQAMFGWNAFIRDAIGPGHATVRMFLAGGLDLATLAFSAGAVRRTGNHPRDRFATLVFATVLVSPHLFAQDLVLVIAPLLLYCFETSGPERRFWLVYAALGWLLTFIHFDVLMGPPDQLAINFVSLWLAGGLVASGLGLSSRLPMRLAAPIPVQGPRRVPWPVQLAGGTGVAAVLLFSIPGFSGHRLASAATYSYTADHGPTYRITVIDVAADGSP